MNPQGINHYENFPVASWLCPPALRPAVVAIYRFARTADDLADEGNAPAETRLNDLARYRQQLERAVEGELCTEWQDIFQPLAVQIQQHHLPRYLFHCLLDAFEQDVRYTQKSHHYKSCDELLHYCQRSANPIGRLLLHLYGVVDHTAFRQSDDICSSLQLINFWQDLSIDLPRGRYYIPKESLALQGLTLKHFLQLGGPTEFQTEAMGRLMKDLCQQARSLMMQGAPLALHLPGRLGWELRLVIQGGLRILDHIEALQGQIWQVRPQLRAADLPILLWRARQMPAVIKGHA